MSDVDLHVSPSQLVTYIHGCARYWAFSYIYGLREPTGEAADRGHKVHKVLEDWQIYATSPDLTTLYGRIAKPAIKHTPPPKSPNVIPEAEVHWTSPQGNNFMFLKDLEYPIGPTAYIWDYKSTSNLKYAHTTEELLNTDPQGIIYPAHRFLVSPDVLEVKCAWLYLPSNPPHYCHPVYAVHEKEHCLERFALLDTIAGYMLEHRRQKTNPLAFKPNPAHCRAFNRQCPFTDRCNLSDLEKMIAMTEASLGPTSNAFLAAIGRNAAGPGPIPGAGAPPAVSMPMPPVPPPAPAAAGFALANLGGAPAAPPPPVFAPPPAAPVQAPVFVPPAAAAPALPWAVPAPVAAPVVVPPPAPAPQQLAWPPVTDRPATVAPSVVIEPAPIDVRTMPFNEAAPPPSPALPPDPVAAPKKKRRTRAEIEAAKAAEANGTATEEQQQDLQAQVDEEGEVVYPGIGTQEQMLEKAKKALSVNNQTINIPAGEDTLLVRIALAMAANPGYCVLNSIDFASRARALAGAVQSEEADL